MSEDYFAQKVSDMLGHELNEDAVGFMSIFCEAFYEHKNLRHFAQSVEEVFATHTQLVSFDIILNNQCQCIVKSKSFQENSSNSEQDNLNQAIKDSIFTKINARVTNRLIKKISEIDPINHHPSIRFEKGNDFYKTLRDDFTIIDKKYVLIFDAVIYAEKNKLESALEVLEKNKPIMKV